ncbi:MAG: RNA polymerase sigma factor [Candidatus Kapaibacterium sp.]
MAEPLSVLRERRLMEEFLAGDDSAFAQIFDQHHERLYLYSARMIGDSSGAEDVMQEVWERLIRLRSDPQQIHNPVGFLLTITRNLSLNYIKKEKRKRRFTQEVEAQLQVEHPKAKNELKDVVLEGLNLLPMKYREVLLLNIYSGYGFEEIAVILNISVDAAWKRASRGRKELREFVLRNSVESK